MVSKLFGRDGVVRLIVLTLGLKPSSLDESFRFYFVGWVVLLAHGATTSGKIYPPAGLPTFLGGLKGG